MYIDRLNLFSDAQALTGNAASTDVIDLGEERRIGVGEPMAVVLYVDVAQAGGGNFTATLQSDTADSFGSAVTLFATGTLTSLAQGARVVLPVPTGVLTRRYIRVNYTLSAGTITVTAALLPQNLVQNDFYYQDNITIS